MAEQKTIEVGVSEFTPGPWEVAVFTVRNGNDTLAVIATKDQESDYAPIAALKHQKEKFSDTDYANARLIAAAPDLLEALEWWLPDIESFEGRSDDYDTLVDKAREAIAKARGEEVANG